MKVKSEAPKPRPYISDPVPLDPYTLTPVKQLPNPPKPLDLPEPVRPPTPAPEQSKSLFAAALAKLAVCRNGHHVEP